MWSILKVYYLLTWPWCLNTLHAFLVLFPQACFILTYFLKNRQLSIKQGLLTTWNKCIALFVFGEVVCCCCTLKSVKNRNRFALKYILSLFGIIERLLLLSSLLGFWRLLLWWPFVLRWTGLDLFKIGNGGLITSSFRFLFMTRFLGVAFLITIKESHPWELRKDLDLV